MIYDAKNKQKCKICTKEIRNNMTGKFTLHLKNEHNITLEKYLLSFLYSEKDLRCNNKLCSNLVGLNSGKPKKYCCKSCGGRKNLTCKYCGKLFFKAHKGTKTCSLECARKSMSKNIRKWHENMSQSQKELHFKKIIDKTARTRRKNKTPSWNSGKTGIYSEETIEKIRAATLRQMKEQKFTKTTIERIMDNLLQDLGLDYSYSYIIEKRQFDFLIKDLNILIECDGDYWHANPKFYPKPAQWQVE
jgi:hypothetical protein